MNHSEIDRWILAEAKRLWHLPLMRTLPRWHRELPDITVRHSKMKAHSSGVTYPNQRIVVTLGSRRADRVVVMLHELVHAALPSRTHHSELFWRVFRSAAREAWPDIDFAFDREPYHDKWHKHNWIVNALAIGRGV